MYQTDILVYCHIYDNKYLGSINIAHPPVFLFLYDASINEYEKIELNRDNMDNLKKEKNIHITFIDEDAKEDEEFGYQKNDIAQLAGLQFDYIFPINCPFTTACDILKLLKPDGEYLHNRYEIMIDHYAELTGMKKDEVEDMVNTKRERLLSLPKYTEDPSVIEFNAYREEKRPYIYKTDINTGLGWYKIYKKADISVLCPPSDRPPSLPPTEPPTSTKKVKNKGCGVSGGRKRTKRTNRNKKRKTKKRKTI